MPMLIKHDDSCPERGWGHSDAAMRVSDEYRLHRLGDPTNAVGKWIACRLSDGVSDHTLYDSKRDGVTHMHHNEQWYMFIQIGPHDMSPCNAEGFIKVKRKLDNAGIRLTDPEHRNGGMDVIPRVAREDMASQMRSIVSGGRTRPSNLITRKDR
jgi:hypothetical protein